MSTHRHALHGKFPSNALIICIYLILNSSLNLMNKWALGYYGLSFPLTLTCTHMAFSFIVLSPFALSHAWNVHKQSLRKQWRGIVYIGSFLAINIALNNMSLLDISLSLNQVIRSAIPVVTSILAVPVENKMPSSYEFVSLVMLAVGVMITVWQGVLAGKPYAIGYCLLGMISNAAMMTFSGKVLSEKLDVVRVTFYTAPISLCLLLPFMLWREFANFSLYFHQNQTHVCIILLVSSTNAVLYNLVHALVIKRTSAVTTTVIGEVKIICLLLLSATVMDEGKDFSRKMLIGSTFAMVGFIMYSHGKMKAFRAHKEELI